LDALPGDEYQFQHRRIRSSRNLRPQPFSAFFDLFDQFAFAVTVTQFEAELFFLSGTVYRVREVAASSCICVTVRSTSSPVDYAMLQEYA
jgi:hypothetical protein